MILTLDSMSRIRAETYAFSRFRRFLYFPPVELITSKFYEFILSRTISVSWGFPEFELYSHRFLREKKSLHRKLWSPAVHPISATSHRIHCTGKEKTLEISLILHRIEVEDDDVEKNF